MIARVLKKTSWCAIDFENNVRAKGIVVIIKKKKIQGKYVVREAVRRNPINYFIKFGHGDVWAVVTAEKRNFFFYFPFACLVERNGCAS